mmetsp:Transcript_29997/g.41210  ORF Transcript_29997/g.41210 Transcript_29997/m.41210 type:complete len:104 (+) Transcript_29997:70-381(+)|eukprot:CAMPEP_0170082674 /NCGR_PEP_ID=MMETSP0019_2-20121128/18184_1 /TAXON_ID=98059 /ORGANISM="Dinobryon sp., Strain UTEXLB2267" /LENGTH=103 /DNA_ID=CAMNT_0010297625 /DNA_START=64 /DNA_END=375 /DNA_ORIENTATION=+
MTSVRRVERTLTQKYNMPSLRALQHLELELTAKLATVYNCEVDDVPVEIDLLHIYHEEASTRRAILEDILKEAPSDCKEILDSLMEEFAKIDAMAAAKAHHDK